MAPPRNQRFYDREPLVANAVALLKQLPPELQTAIADGLAILSGGENRLARLKSMGAENVLPLFKSKKKRRGYDQNPDFHQAVNCLRVLTPEERGSVAFKVVTIAVYADHYLHLCDVAALGDACPQVAELRNQTISLGPVAAKQHLLKACAGFLGSFNLDSVRLGKDGSRIFSN